MNAEQLAAEGAPSYSPRELAAAEAIQAIEAQDNESDPDYPALTTHGALRLAKAAIAAAQLVDAENGIVRIRSSEIQKASTGLVREQAAKLDKALALHVREVLAVHEGYGEEAWCPNCRVHWPCEDFAALTATVTP